MSSVPARPMTETAIQIFFVSTWQKSGLLFRYPLFLPATNRDYWLDIIWPYPA